jgi:hypothetical protein
MDDGDKFSKFLGHFPIFCGKVPYSYLHRLSDCLAETPARPLGRRNADSARGIEPGGSAIGEEGWERSVGKEGMGSCSRRVLEVPETEVTSGTTSRKQALKHCFLEAELPAREPRRKKTGTSGGHPAVG